MIKMSLKTKVQAPQGMNAIKEEEEDSYHHEDWPVDEGDPFNAGGDYDMNAEGYPGGWDTEEAAWWVKQEQNGGYEPNWNATFNIDAFVQDEEEEFRMKEGRKTVKLTASGQEFVESLKEAFKSSKTVLFQKMISNKANKFKAQYFIDLLHLN